MKAQRNIFNTFFLFLPELPESISFDFDCGLRIRVDHFENGQPDLENRKNKNKN